MSDPKAFRSFWSAPVSSEPVKDAYDFDPNYAMKKNGAQIKNQPQTGTSSSSGSDSTAITGFGVGVGAASSAAVGTTSGGYESFSAEYKAGDGNVSSISSIVSGESVKGGADVGATLGGSGGAGFGSGAHSGGAGGGGGGGGDGIGGGGASESTPLLPSYVTDKGADTAQLKGRRFLSAKSLCCCLLFLLLLLLLLLLFFHHTPLPIIVTPIAAFCNPFAVIPAPVDIVHHHGLVALLYVLPPNLAQFATSSSYYLQNSVFGNATFFFSNLDTPTRIFTRVFQTKQQSAEKEAKLLPSQYFMLSFHSVLRPSGDSAPYNFSQPFQFAMISDDGASMFQGYLEENQVWPAPSSVLIDDDDVHMSRISYSAPSITLSPTDGLPITVRYFQGPPAHIALQLLYRQPSSAAATDAGKYLPGPSWEQGNDLYWHVGKEGEISMPTEKYQDLLRDGWRVVPEEWFWLPERYEGKAEVDAKIAAGIDPCL